MDNDSSSASDESNGTGVSAGAILSELQNPSSHMPTHARPPKRQKEGTRDDASASTEPTLMASTELVAQGPPSQTSHECKFNAFSKFDIALLLILIPWVGSLTGDVYKLTIDDVKKVAQSDQVGSEIFLTWPLYLQTAPFITVPVSNSLALEFALRGDYVQGVS